MGGPKVRNHSRITDELPPEIREMVNRLLIEGVATYDDIQVFLTEKGHDISRASIGRYGKNFLNFYKRVLVAQDQAKTLVSEAGDGMILEEAIAKGLSQQLIEMLVSGDLDLRENTRVLSDFARLQTSSALRERMKKEYAKKADKAVEKIEAALGGKKKAIDPDVLKTIKEEIYGIV